MITWMTMLPLTPELRNRTSTRWSLFLPLFLHWKYIASHYYNKLGTVGLVPLWFLYPMTEKAKMNNVLELIFWTKLVIFFTLPNILKNILNNLASSTQLTHLTKYLICNQSFSRDRFSLRLNDIFNRAKSQACSSYIRLLHCWERAPPATDTNVPYAHVEQSLRGFSCNLPRN